MKIFREVPDNRGLLKSPVVTVGNFDGVHRGHGAIFRTVTRRAEEISGEPVAVTFAAHPRKVISPDANIAVLTTTEEKVNAIYSAGVRNIVVLDFTPDMAAMSAWDFFNDILITKLDMKELVFGYDHAFGKNREGSFENISRMAAGTGIPVSRVEGQETGGRPVSSTWIREALAAGDTSLAAELLGRPYTLSGLVARGEGRGRGLGFPTANIAPDSAEKIIPARGVYAVKVNIGDEKYSGMLNIGVNPTFGAGRATIEVNILDFSEEIYGRHISVEFHDRLRDEKTFPGRDALIHQLKEDSALVRALFSGR
jgi:riboflavin kinase/FMN adenylyltransferase